MTRSDCLGQESHRELVKWTDADLGELPGHCCRKRTKKSKNLVSGRISENVIGAGAPHPRPPFRERGSSPLTLCDCRCALFARTMRRETYDRALRGTSRA